MSFAANLYAIVGEIQRILGRPNVKDPALLQKCGTMLREHYGDDIFIDRLLEELPEAENVVITDVRFKNEFDRLRDKGAVLIEIIRPDRLIDRDPNHISEVDLDGANWDYGIENTGTIEELCHTMDSILRTEMR